jgi:Restriction endonuclease
VTNTSDPEPIFVWRDTVLTGTPPMGGLVQDRGRTAGGPNRGCPFCRESLVHGSRGGFGYSENHAWCGFCGWGIRRAVSRKPTDFGDAEWRRVLRAFDIQSAELSLAELRAAIAVRPDRAVDLSPRRFEELVGDVFANGGYDVELTRSTRDGGRDLVLLREADDVEAIVEVKRYRRRVGVELVRQLRGVQVRENVPYAILVAASGFTAGAREEACAPAPSAMGFALDLFDIDELMRAMDILVEPVASPAAMGRSRDRYRAWLSDSFGAEAALPPDRPFDADSAW